MRAKELLDHTGHVKNILNMSIKNYPEENEKVKSVVGRIERLKSQCSLVIYLVSDMRSAALPLYRLCLRLNCLSQAC